VDGRTYAIESGFNRSTLNDLMGENLRVYHPVYNSGQLSLLPSVEWVISANQGVVAELSGHGRDRNHTGLACHRLVYPTIISMVSDRAMTFAPVCSHNLALCKQLD